MKQARPQGAGSGERSRHHGLERRGGTRVGMMPRPRRWFRAPARSRPEAGGQFSRWGPAVARHPALDGYAPRRESSRRLGSAPPRRYAPLCRAPPGELPRGRRSPAGAPPSVDGAWPRSQKLMAANSVRCPRVRGESVKGGLAPLSQKGYIESELAAARREAGKEVSIPARSAGRSGSGGSIPSSSTTRTGPAICPRSRTARHGGRSFRAAAHS